MAQIAMRSKTTCSPNISEEKGKIPIKKVTPLSQELRMPFRLYQSKVASSLVKITANDDDALRHMP